MLEIVWVLAFLVGVVFVWAFLVRKRPNRNGMAATVTPLPSEQPQASGATLFDLHAMREKEVLLLASKAAAAIVREENSQIPDVAELLPHPTDDSLRRLCEMYLGSTPAQRFYINLQVDRKAGWALHVFGDTCALAAWKNKSAESIRLGLTAQAVWNLTGGDARDFFRPVTLLFNAAKRIGADPVVLLNEIADVSPSPIATLLRDYLRRPPELQSLQSMMIPSTFFR
jgi:hypothetical protein